jgi:hypothetical protein
LQDSRSSSSCNSPWQEASQLPALQLYQQQHEQLRSALLSQQQQRWWQEVGECSRAQGGSGRSLQQLQVPPQL